MYDNYASDKINRSIKERANIAERAYTAKDLS